MATYEIEIRTKHSERIEATDADMAIDRYIESHHLQYNLCDADYYKIVVHRYDTINGRWSWERTDKREPRREKIETWIDNAITMLTREEREQCLQERREQCLKSTKLLSKSHMQDPFSSTEVSSDFSDT